MLSMMPSPRAAHIPPTMPAPRQKEAIAIKADGARLARFPSLAKGLGASGMHPSIGTRFRGGQGGQSEQTERKTSVER